jgi:hypothetical protein
VAVDGDVRLLQLGDDLDELGAGPVPGHRLTVAGELLRVHLPHPGADAQALYGQLDVAGVADGRPDVRLVRGLVLAEPDVAVGPEDLRLPELGGQFLGQFGHRPQDLLGVDGLVLRPVGLGVVGQEPVVEVQGLLRPPAERHRPGSFLPVLTLAGTGRDRPP